MTAVWQDRTTRRCGFVLALLVLCPLARGEEVVYDYARVLWVEPVTQSVTAPTQRRHCRASASTPLGDLRADGASLDLVSTIRREAARESREPACVVRVEATAEERVVGYRVGYRYGGEAYERTVSAHPGDRIRVRVSVRPER